ncbi:MAG: hypothetical protein QXH60_00495 [Candidatus Pacearchaeota archaeon]
MQLTLIRFFSLSLIILLVYFLKIGDFNLIIISFTFSHFFIGYLYSYNQYKELTSKKKGYFILVFLILVSIILFYFYPEFIHVYFLIHHVLNEAYLSTKDLILRNSRFFNMFITGRIIFHSIIFGFITKIYSSFEFYKSWLLITFFIISSIFFISLLFYIKKDANKKYFFDNVIFEIVGIAFVIFSLFFVANFPAANSKLYVVAYHVFFWALYPIPKLRKIGRDNQLNKYFITTITTFIIFLILGYIIISVFNYETLVSLFFIFTYLHISLSFALSDAQPLWITKFFKNK